MMGIGWMLLSLQALPILFGLIPGVCSDNVSPYLYSEEYDKGELGLFPHHEYKSSPFVSPILNYKKYDPICDDGLHIMITPRGEEIHQQGPMILNAKGDLVFYRDYGPTYGLDVHNFKGEDYLTFWAGNDGVTGHGEGNYYLLDSTYREAYKFGAGKDIPGDLHEIHFTRDGTALFTMYDVVPADISSVGGPVDGWLYDGTFQEMDIETGDVLFQWHASEHISFDEAYRGREGNGEEEDRPWDFFHINSVDKDSKGNFLISSRYMGSLYYIDGKNGDVIWKLGGKQNQFKDLSDGAATNMSWQHHARFHDNGKSITLFDNRSRVKGAPELPSRGLHLDVDDENMTVSVRQSYWNSRAIISQSQGSMQILDDGRVLLGYGYVPVFTEFSKDGEVLCDVRWGPQSAFRSGDIVSYRTFKRKWVGKPTTPPDLFIESMVGYVSWNGATEVATWVLKGADTADAKGEEFTFLTAVVKSGFETKIQFPVETHPYVRISALDADGATLGHTEVVDTSDTVVETDENSDYSRPLFFFLGFIAAVILSGISFCIFKMTPWLRSRWHTTATPSKTGMHFYRSRMTSWFRSRWHSATTPSKPPMHEWDPKLGGGDEEEALAVAGFSDQSDLSDEETEYSERKKFSDDLNSPPESSSTRRYDGEI